MLGLGTRAAVSHHELAGDLSRNISAQVVGFVQERFVVLLLESGYCLFSNRRAKRTFFSALEFTWFAGRGGSYSRS